MATYRCLLNYCLNSILFSDKLLVTVVFETLSLGQELQFIKVNDKQFVKDEHELLVFDISVPFAKL